MSNITLKELAEQLGADRSGLRRFALKNGFKPVRLDRAPGTRGSSCIAFTAEDAEQIKALRGNREMVHGGEAEQRTQDGFFYAIQVIPELAPNRVKLGFAVDVSARLASHRTSAPTAILLKSWPCRRTWEFTAMDSISREDSSLILNEVFEFGDIPKMIERADAFFALLPKP